jgi:hypothetical protein
MYYSNMKLFTHEADLSNSETPKFFSSQYSILFQVIFGVVCSILNILVGLLRQTGIPMYMDCIFTAAASFFGAIGGLICALFTQLINCVFFSHPLSELPFVICSLTIVLVIRLYFRNKQMPNYLDLLIISFFLAIIISLEGALVYILVYKLFAYDELVQSKYFTFILLRQNFSLLLSAFLSRLPVNLIDKTVAIFAGYGVSVLTKKIFKRK